MCQYIVTYSSDKSIRKQQSGSSTYDSEVQVRVQIVRYQSSFWYVRR